MSSLCLPDSLTPLLMHVEPLLATADQYQLGESVSVKLSDSGAVEIQIEERQFSLVFNQAEAGIDGYRVLDQWLAPYPTLREMQHKVEQDPSLVVCDLPTDKGCVDIWHHKGEARAVYCHHAGASDPQRAMLLTALALDYPLEDAVTLARAHARGYQESNADGHGEISWPMRRELFPRPLTANHPEVAELGWHSKEVAVAPFAETDVTQLALYPVVDSAEWVERLLKLDVKTTQLRIKKPQDIELEEQIQRITALGNAYHAQVFVNDYWQLAIKHHAYGVHLGQEDLDTADLTAIQQAGLRIGLSTHGYFEILRAAEFSPSYIALGHIYPTTTKDMPSKPQGPNRLALYQKLIGDEFPTVAIGGIDLSRAEKVWRTGVSSVAVVRAVTQADDTKAAIEAFNQLLIRHAAVGGPLDAG
ncbi:thiamine phosphate synthase [Photobacterium lipolyticum]|uniref:Thiamine-phosphate synthase n=1 Tax=Photobacterium lipolyticum TaxID=266810 RepID=A0A2T3MU48_9GAMM|nr:thiamine phosphate synthase [Photobacterium lipolyticum]PSW03444.1 thiamine phosphate synthase [Photobacterium lipolyticum]